MSKLVVVVVTVCLLPFIAYFCAKFGVVGYLQGKKFFQEIQEFDDE